MTKHNVEVGGSGAAQILGVSEATAVRWFNRGLFPQSYRLPNGERVFVVADLLAIKQRMGQRRRMDYRNPALTSAAAGRETMDLVPVEDFDALLKASTAAADDLLASIGRR